MKRLQFLVKDEVYNRLLELQQKTEANSLSEVFRDALRAYAWMVSEYAGGQSVLANPLKKFGPGAGTGWPGSPQKEEPEFLRKVAAVTPDEPGRTS